MQIDPQELPDVHYKTDPILITPDRPTPKHNLYLSNLDDQKFLRFSIKYLYLYEKSVELHKLKRALSTVLSYYYPLAGRLIYANNNDNNDNDKLEVDCNGKGALFVEAFMDYTVEKFLEICDKPNKSFRKLLYRVNSSCFLDVPPLVIQVTNLRCGGMILCTGINHCLCDGIGTSQFLNAWSHIISNPNSNPPIAPFHTRHMLKPRSLIRFPDVTHPAYSHFTPDGNNNSQKGIIQYLQSQPLVPVSITFSPSQILHLKGHFKCTNFEALATHTWRAWARSLGLSWTLNVKLLFSVNVRKGLRPPMEEGYYGNSFVLGCAESMVKDLVNENLGHGVKLIQDAKACLNDEYIRSIVDLLEVKMVKTDLFASLVISQWSRLGLEDVNFGEGKPLYMGPLTSDVYCLFTPVIGEPCSIRVLISLPESVAKKFEFYMRESFDRYENGKENGHHENKNKTT